MNSRSILPPTVELQVSMRWWFQPLFKLIWATNWLRFRFGIFPPTMREIERVSEWLGKHAARVDPVIR